MGQLKKVGRDQLSRCLAIQDTPIEFFFEFYGTVNYDIALIVGESTTVTRRSHEAFAEAHQLSDFYSNVVHTAKGCAYINRSATR